MKMWCVRFWIVAAFCAVAQGAEDGLVAHWTFDEGKGALARDATGNGNDATIHGQAAFAEFGRGYALRLDGVDDYVDCGKGAALNIEKAGSIVLWVKPRAVRGGIFSRSGGGGWADERLVLSFKDYGGAKQLLYAVADGETYQYAANLPLPGMNAWSQMALTIEGPRVRVYRDGVLLRSDRAVFAPKFADLPLLLGRSQGLGTPFLDGLIDDVRVYNRVLSQRDIIALCKAQAAPRGIDKKAFERPVVTAKCYPLSGRMLVGIEYQLMAPMPAGAVLDVEVARPGKPKPIRRVAVSAPEGRTSVETILDLQHEPPGTLSVTVRARRPRGGPLGEAVTESVDWPKRDPMFSPEKGIRVLNGFVFELLNEKSLGSQQFSFHNPREGWIYVAVPWPYPGIAGNLPGVIVDSEKVSLRLVGKNFETMRYLPEGPHKIKLTGGTNADRLIVRAVPELFYDMYGINPLVPETGDYTWAWLGKHVLDHYNCVTGTQDPDKQADEIKEWTSRGGRWFTQRSLPWVKTAREAYEYWAGEPGMIHPLLHGIWADEFSSGEKYRKMYPIWCEGLRLIHADPRFRGRKFYAYMGMTYSADYDPLTKAIAECGYRLAPEWYLRERPTEQQAIGYMSPPYERANRQKYDAAHPGAGLNRVVILGLLSQPEESCDIYPDVNFNVYLDVQLHLMANDPAFFGTRGLQGYYSPYCGEEQTRLFARLVRHYAIEGRTHRMIDDPYKLTHLDNPDFADGTTGWTVSAAGPDTLAAKIVEKFGWLQGRYLRNGVGETVVWTKRSPQRPNTIAQTIEGLTPGRPYSLRFFTGDYQDYLSGKSRPYKHAVSVTIENADVLPAKSFQALIKSNYAHVYKSFDRNNPYRMNYHQRVFRPKATTARLVLSDWPSPTGPGGQADAELIWNFIQVQPYFPE